MNEQQQQALAAGLRALAARTRNASSSPHVERAVLEAMARSFRLKPEATTFGLSGKPEATPLGVSDTRFGLTRFAGIAAALVLVVGGALWTARFERPADGHIVRPSGFVWLPNAGALPEMETASIVRVSLPVGALPGYGMAIVPEMSVDSVEAELLVAQDGQPRAIRLVHDSDNRRSRR